MKKFIVLLGLIVIFVSLMAYFISGHTVSLLMPHGMIAEKERSLIITAVLIMLIAVVPTFIMAFYISMRYRASNKKTAHYDPDWTGNNTIKYAFWGFLVVIMSVLSVLVWNGAHELDPFKPISSPVKPITIQVVALEWKWLFIYPEQHIATVNYVAFPAKTPVAFQLTADAPMNSFWIPQLGGQMFAMAGMQNQLHLIADKPGNYAGTEVEINGKGYANMRFTATAYTQEDFDNWVQQVKKSGKPLDQSMYEMIAKPSENFPVTSFASVDENLYDGILMKYMATENNTKQE
jgi:cytochrome o ubiquinol oxidase subunit 2